MKKSTPTFFPERVQSRCLQKEDASHRQEEGFALIISLMMMIVLTIILVALMRGSWLQEAMAGNTREKIRALNAAQSAAKYAEYWLNNNNAVVPSTTVTCAGVITTQICSNAAAISTSTPPLSSYTEYAPTGATTSASGGSNTYYRNPGYYIQYLGTNSSSSQVVYRITAFGYGGNQYAVAVVQSNVGIKAVISVDGP